LSIQSSNAADAGKLARLFQIVSPALPVGAFAYSQGLETAVDQGLVNNEDEVTDWCSGILANNLARLDLPAFRAMIEFIDLADNESALSLNDQVLSFRETSELRNESTLMAKALLRLLKDLGYGSPCDSDSGSDKKILELVEPSNDYDWVFAFALAVDQFGIQKEQAMVAYLWTWLENQVAAAIKLVPLGQTQGQHILIKLGDQLGEMAEQSLQLDVSSMANLSPGLAILSSQHETQYSRLFRS